jgi:hypothetical protein
MVVTIFLESGSVFFAKSTTFRLANCFCSSLYTAIMSLKHFGRLIFVMCDIFSAVGI